MTPDDITRLADIMASAIKYAGPDGDIAVYKVEYWESELRTLAQQGKAWPAIVQHCVATEAVTPDESDPHGTIRRLIDYHVEMDREQGKAGGVAEPEWLTALRSEVFMAPMKSNFTLSRDELKHILAPQPKDAP